MLQSVDSGVAILREFLQPEAYNSIFSETKEFAEAWMLEAGTIAQGKHK